ncbi:MAG: MATE family efflux transporter, partial [Chthoniobacterales bacterium]
MRILGFPHLAPYPMSAFTFSPGLRRLAHEGRLTSALALPLAAGQISQMLIALSDTLMVGRLGVLPLAAATFANNVLYLPFIFGLGFTMAVSIRVSQARGADDKHAARAALRHGFYLALVIGVLTMLGVWGIQPFLGLFRQEPDIIRAVPRYFLLVAASMIPALAAMAVKNHADAMNRPWVPLWILLAGAAINVFFNWVFIYGKLGAPRMGLDGSGLATLLARILILIALLIWTKRSRAVRDWVPTHWFRAPEWGAVRDLLRLGLPTSLQLLAEVSAFVMATLLIGTLGAAALASHQVAMTCAAMIFMVPLGFSMALTVRMGEAWG